MFFFFFYYIFFFFEASIFSQSETSEALTEICRVDPTFDVAQFIRVVQYDIIPNIFEVITIKLLTVSL